MAHFSKTSVYLGIRTFWIRFNLDQFEFFVIWQHIPWNFFIVCSRRGPHYSDSGGLFGPPWNPPFLAAVMFEGFHGGPWFWAPDLAHVVLRDACLLVVSYCFESISNCRISFYSYLGLEHQLFFLYIHDVFLYCSNCVIYLYRTCCVLINSIIIIIIMIREPAVTNAPNELGAKKHRIGVTYSHNAVHPGNTTLYLGTSLLL